MTENELIAQTAQVMRIEIDSAVATAKQYPRDVKQCRKDLIEYVTMDDDTAAACSYSLPRGNKEIKGPSVRMAELAVMAFGNIRAGFRIIGIDDKYVTAEGVAKDIEKNTEVLSQAVVRIVDSKGKRYNDDMIQVSQMAAGAKAYRNAVFKIIPAAFINQALVAAENHSVKVANINIKEAVPKMFKAFEEYKVKPEWILSFFKLENKSQMTGTHVVKLQAYYQAIKEGTNPRSIFKPSLSEMIYPDDQKFDIGDDKPQPQPGAQEEFYNDANVD